MSDTFFVFAHVLVAIMTFGPVSVASSMFPRLARDGADAAAGTMARITKNYGLVSILVPLLGFSAALAAGNFNRWIWESLLLIAVSIVVLIFWVVPLQARTLALELQERKRQFGRLQASAGVFNLMWLLVLIRMFWH
jgi:heme exporter protein D